MLAAGLVLALLAARLWLCGRFELAGDEAYFWLWSRRLEWGYFSKGPGIAVLLRLGTWWAGDSELGVRLASVLASAGTSWGLFALGRLLYSARVGFWVVVVANTTPLFCAGSLLATADMPSICAWTWAAVLFWRLHGEPARSTMGRQAGWIGLGVLLAAGTLVRFVVVAEPLCFGLFLAATQEGRRRFRNSGFWLMLAAFGVCLAPWVAWAARHGWVTLHHLAARGALDRPWRLRPLALGEFAALQAALVLPYTAGLWLAFRRPAAASPASRITGAAASLASRAAGAERTEGAEGAGAACSGAAARRYLLSLSLPILAFYAALALNDPGQPNWTGPAFIAAAVLLAATGLERGDRRLSARRLNQITVAAGVIITLAIHLALGSASWLPRGLDPLARLRGGGDLTRQVIGEARRRGIGLVIASHYQLASWLAFYQGAGAGVAVSTPCGGVAESTPYSRGPRNQLDLWGGYGAEWLGRDALFVAPDGAVPGELARQFAAVEVLPAVSTEWHGRRVRTYSLLLCRRLLHACGGSAAVTAGGAP